MKVFHSFFFLTFFIFGKVHAANTVLLTDNFDAGGYGDFYSFNNANSSTQTGILAPSNYHISFANSEGWRLQHSNNGQLLSLPSSFVSPVHDFGISANQANAPLLVQFNITVGNWNGSTDSLTWAQFNIARSPKLDPSNSNVFFASLFRLNGQVSLLSGGGALGSGTGSMPSWSANDLVSFKFSDTSGSGSAFNGNGSRISMTIGSSTITYDVPQMDTGYITFGGYSYGLDGGMAKVDNLSVSLVPEPSALSLFAVGLGGVAILRRRRS